MKIILVLVSFCFSLVTFAQDFKFGKVSNEELQEAINPLDSAANAAYLYKERYTYFEYVEDRGFQQITEVHERIKIYNQEGFDYATKQIRLYASAGSEEEISGIKGNTYNLVDGKIEDFKLTKNGIFESELSKYTNQVKFTLPNIKAGCVVEYKYKIESPFISKVDDFVFQDDIPIKKLEAKFEAPEYFNFKVNSKGYFSVVPKINRKRDKITFNYKNRRGAGGTTFSSSDVEFEKELATYSLENIPALKEEAYVNSMNNYRSSVKYELSFTKFPESAVKYYSTTWEDVVKTIYQNSSFGNELDKRGYFEDEVDALIGSVSDPVKRAALIFNLVKTKIKWNGYYGYYTDNGVKKAYKEQVGNVADVNLMLTSMLQHAGLKAYPVLVSTRRNGIPLFPTREGYNYVVSYVKLAKGDILLDATNKYSTPNILPFQALNWQGRVIAEQGGSKLIDLYPKQQSKNSIVMMATLS
ncbi:DUF3857 domain-containing protein, partial [Algibacter sp.]|nr:DUF3857 domain-containing protein [Algibacter sp.]